MTLGDNIFRVDRRPVEDATAASQPREHTGGSALTTTVPAQAPGETGRRVARRGWRGTAGRSRIATAALRLGVLGTVAVVAGACSFTTGDHSGATVYGVAHVSAQTQADLHASALIRGIDPCGLFDLTAVAGLGHLVQMAPFTDPAECVAGIEPASMHVEDRFLTPYPEQLSITLNTTMTDPGPVSTVDGYTVIEGADNQRCDYVVEFPLPGDGRPERAMIMPSGFGGDGGDDTAPADCAAAMIAVHGITAAAKAGLPQRSSATLAVPLTGVDPCSLLAHLPHGITVAAHDWTVKPQPFQCEFLANTPNGRDDISVTFGINETGATQALPSDGSVCHSAIEAGAVDGNLPGNDLPDQLAKLAQVSTVVNVDSNCTDQAALVTAAHQAFGI